MRERDHRRLHPWRSAAAGVVLLAILGCGAPASRPARGPIADQVQASLESGNASFDHADWDRLLAEGTAGGRVDYPFFQKQRADLESYLKRVAEADLASLAPDHLKALLINAYNALTVLSILNHPEVSSIREIDGVWSRTKHPVGGFDLTLDEIEHNLLRPYFRDPRIHFSVNCASASCAPLPPWAFDGDQLDGQLEERTRSFLTDPANVQAEGGALYLSSYFDWYGEDFVAADAKPRAESIPLFVAAYATPEVTESIRSQADLEIVFLEYDWSLNAAERPVPPHEGSD